MTSQGSAEASAAPGRVRESKNEQSSEVRKAKNMQFQTLRPAQSVLSRKVGAKPADSRRERSQDGPVMVRGDVAGLPSRTGLPLGRKDCGRASTLRAKSGFSASTGRSQGAAYAVNGVITLPVPQVIMLYTRKVHSTDEVLRCPTHRGRETAGYKPYAKGQHHAPVAGTVSPRPRLRGWQQSRSRGASSRITGRACFERQNLRVPFGSGQFMGKVSWAIQATKWPGGTSSRQPAPVLRNIPQQLLSLTRRFIHLWRNQHGNISHC